MEIKQIIWIVLYYIALIGLVVGIVTKNITPGESAIGFGKLHERINRNDQMR